MIWEIKNKNTATQLAILSAFTIIVGLAMYISITTKSIWDNTLYFDLVMTGAILTAVVLPVLLYRLILWVMRARRKSKINSWIEESSILTQKRLEELPVKGLEKLVSIQTQYFSEFGYKDAINGIDFRPYTITKNVKKPEKLIFENLTILANYEYATEIEIQYKGDPVCVMKSMEVNSVIPGEWLFELEELIKEIGKKNIPYSKEYEKVARDLLIPKLTMEPMKKKTK
jgi:hypothetical protein